MLNVFELIGIENIHRPYGGQGTYNNPICLIRINLDNMRRCGETKWGNGWQVIDTTAIWKDIRFTLEVHLRYVVGGQKIKKVIIIIAITEIIPSLNAREVCEGTSLPHVLKNKRVSASAIARPDQGKAETPSEEATFIPPRHVYRLS